MKLTDISNSKAKEIINGAPKEATHFSCIEGKVQYYKGEETVISSFDEVFINVFRDIFQPSVFPLSDLENQMNIDNLATQTPEEKEALDNIGGTVLSGSDFVSTKEAQSIETTPHQYEMSKFSGEAAWNGEGLPPVGSPCKVNRDSFVYRVMYSSEYVVVVQNLDNDNTTAHGMDIILDLHKGNYTFSKPESPQQREDRERLEAAYDLYEEGCKAEGGEYDSFDSWSENKYAVVHFLAIVDKTNYRKESN